MEQIKKFEMLINIEKDFIFKMNKKYIICIQRKDYFIEKIAINY